MSTSDDGWDDFDDDDVEEGGPCPPHCMCYYSGEECCDCGAQGEDDDFDW